MDYGFRSRNGQNFFQIDSENRALNVAASGSYIIGKRRRRRQQSHKQSSLTLRR